MASTSLKSNWIYLPGDGRLIEYAQLQGDRGALFAPHMHEETQLCMVLTGRRRFMTPVGAVEARAGETILIGARVPHQALGLIEPTRVVNLYFKAPAPCWEVAVMATPPSWLAGQSLSNGRVISDWLESRPAMPDPLGQERQEFAELIRGRKSIDALANELGMARESFSRSFRRLLGVTPRIYRVGARLNIARSLLRSGASPAEAAADAAFADQSHLGRAFRAAFGTTPAAYRRVFSV